MRYHELSIQTQREFPNNARSPGFGWLVRAGYLTRDNAFTRLGEHALAHLRHLARESWFAERLAGALPLLVTAEETFFPLSIGEVEVARCPSCGYTARREHAAFCKAVFSDEAPLPVEKVFTPECHTIESLANYLSIPKEKTAKAMMFTRQADGRFVFVVLRGDMTLSEAKLKQTVGEVRLATPEEIERAGAVAGYASPIGLRDALIVVDDLIPRSPNLVAGANQAGYHLLNTNCGRDYQPHHAADLVLAGPDDRCAVCDTPLSFTNCVLLATRKSFDLPAVLHALAETHHDAQGLTFPPPFAPFQVYLMHVPSKHIDTRSAADDLYRHLQQSGFSVLFDDRDERAGVKFNDADLIGCPIRITVGERGLQNQSVELKQRKTGETITLPISEAASFLSSLAP